jgi:hypothetical protein
MTKQSKPVRLEITCTNKTNNENLYEQISDVGVTINGKTVILPLKDAVQAVDNGQYTFFVNMGGVQVDVEVDEREGHRYLRTIPDSTRKNNLLSLKPCVKKSLWE